MAYQYPDETQSHDATVASSSDNVTALQGQAPGTGPGAPENYNTPRQDHRIPYHPPVTSLYGPGPFPPHPHSAPPSYMPQPIHPPLNMFPQEAPRESTSAAKASMLIATGGLLGMTAAAAIRWLNGEDFSLFPPSPRQEATSRKHENDRSDLLTQQMEAVVQEVRIQNKHQEKILQRLSSGFEKQRTNECIDLLRTSQKPSDDALMEKLTNIQSELYSLRQSLLHASGHESDDNWDARLSDTLENLQNCVANISLPDSGLGHNSKMNSVSNSTPDIPFVFLSDDNSTDNLPLINAGRNLEEKVRKMVELNDPDDLRAGAQLLYLYVSNLSNHPTAPRYRKIFTSNDSFQKVDRLVGGKEFLLSLGFVENGSYLEWTPEAGIAKDMDRQIELLSCATSALKVVKTVPSNAEPEFVERAVSAAVLPVRAQSEDLGTSSCPPTPMHPLAGTMSPRFEEMQTPEIGLIASPPNTRKQIYDPDKPEFPLLHENTSNGIHHVESPVMSMSPESNLDRTTESLSPIRGDARGVGTDATDVLWK